MKLKPYRKSTRQSLPLPYSTTYSIQRQTVERVYRSGYEDLHMEQLPLVTSIRSKSSVLAPAGKESIERTDGKRTSLRWCEWVLSIGFLCGNTVIVMLAVGARLNTATNINAVQSDVMPSIDISNRSHI